MARRLSTAIASKRSGRFLMRHSRWLKTLLWLTLVGLVMGCVRLPDYARPRFHVPEDGSTLSREGFAYRPLTIQDFRATSLPPGYIQYDHHINAHSCITIRPSRGLKVRITQGVYEGRSSYVGSFSQVTFEAIFVPACSWWNPDVAKNRKAYVLQHEQIHFALAELAARKLSREAQEELKDYLAINEGYREVQEELNEKIKAMTRASMEASFAEHTAFDEDTSLYHDPRAQRWWLEEVEARLAKSKREREDLP